MISDGYVASWRGDLFEASPTLENGRLYVRIYSSSARAGFDEAASQRYVKVVSPKDLDRLSYVTRICQWQGQPCRIVSRNDANEILLEYLGGQTPVAERLRMNRIERGVYRIWVPEDTVAQIQLDEARIL